VFSRDFPDFGYLRLLGGPVFVRHQAIAMLPDFFGNILPLDFIGPFKNAGNAGRVNAKENAGGGCHGVSLPSISSMACFNACRFSVANNSLLKFQILELKWVSKNSTKCL
jgi:hypothetical protein